MIKTSVRRRRVCLPGFFGGNNFTGAAEERMHTEEQAEPLVAFRGFQLASDGEFCCRAAFISSSDLLVQVNEMLCAVLFVPS